MKMIKLFLMLIMPGGLILGMEKNSDQTFGVADTTKPLLDVSNSDVVFQIISSSNTLMDALKAAYNISLISKTSYELFSCKEFQRHLNIILQNNYEKDLDIDLYLNRAVFEAVRRHRPDILVFLLKLGAKTNIKNFVRVPDHLVKDGEEDGITLHQVKEAIIYYTNETPLSCIIHKRFLTFGNGAFDILSAQDKPNYLKTVKLLLNHAQEVNMFYWLAYDIDVLKIFVDAYLRLNNQQFPKLEKTVYDAARIANVKVIKYLMGKNVALNFKDSDGMTPLMRAAEKGYIKIAKLLLDAGADIYLRNSKGLTALEIAKIYKNHRISNLIRSKKSYLSYLFKNMFHF